MTDLQKTIAKDLLSIQAVFFRPDQPFTLADSRGEQTTPSSPAALARRA